jgi:hypothetical protein
MLKYKNWRINLKKLEFVNVSPKTLEYDPSGIEIEIRIGISTNL